MSLHLALGCHSMGVVTDNRPCSTLCKGFLRLPPSRCLEYVFIYRQIDEVLGLKNIRVTGNWQPFGLAPDDSPYCCVRLAPRKCTPWTCNPHDRPNSFPLPHSRSS